MLSESEKGPVRPLFVQVVKGLGFDQADTIVRPPLPASGGAPVPRENIQLQIKFELLPTDIQSQFYSLMGLHPSQLPPTPPRPAPGQVPGQPPPPKAAAEPPQPPPPPDVDQPPAKPA